MSPIFNFSLSIKPTFTSSTYLELLWGEKDIQVLVDHGLRDAFIDEAATHDEPRHARAGEA